jgi:uncharacterized NAD(P)/FAD-binding protein YdhS
LIIVGAGFSGSMLAVQLMRESEPPSVALLDKSPAFGPGLAYGAVAPEHLLNVPAGKMSAFPDESDHFLQWVRQHEAVAAEFGVREISPAAFLPRGLYGRYLHTLVEDAARDQPALRLWQAEAIDIEVEITGGYLVTLADRYQLRASQIVLAWGNLPPAVPPMRDGDRPGPWLLNPWSLEARDALAQPGELLIIGTGLTCIDLLATARQRGRVGKIHVLSRHGFFPQAHCATTPRPPCFPPDALPTSIRAIYRAVRQEIRRVVSAGGNWREVVDALRPLTQDLWHRLPAAERRRFLRHVRPVWEALRHRTAPEMRAAKDDLEQRGQLVRHRGRIVQMVPCGEEVEITYRPRGTRTTQSLRVKTVINATGPETDPKRIASPLLQNLIRRGLVRPDPLGLGVEATDHNPPSADPLQTVGSLRKGALWESTAVRELRVQAQELAQRVLATRVSIVAGGAGKRWPLHLWMFEI